MAHKITQQTAPWCHTDAEPKPPEFQWGPLEGTAGLLAASLFQDQKPDRRRLRTKARNGAIWVKRVQGRLYDMWMLYQDEYLVAQDRWKRLRGERNTKPEEPQTARNDTKLHDTTRPALEAGFQQETSPPRRQDVIV